MDQEGTIFFLIILITGPPLLYFLVLRDRIQKQGDAIEKQLEKNRKRLEELEQKLDEKEKGQEPTGSLSSSPTQPPEKDEEQASKPLSSESKGVSQSTEKERPQAYREESKKAGKEQSKQEVPKSSQQKASDIPLSSDQAAESQEEALPQDKGASRPEPEGRTEWERFIGENLINKIGIGVLVLGIAFFVKYAIDQGWLGEIGRVATGILSGAALIMLAHKLRERFKAFSSVLAGGGLAVLYFTITIGFQEYQLFSQPAAFIIMLLITGFAVLLSLLYERQELAVIALLGGFATPFMVSSGEGNYIVLFTYLILLNLGMLTLAYMRHWTVVNILSYLATILIYGGWYLERISTDPLTLPYPGSLLFATAFFLIFFSMALAYKVRKSLPFKAEDLSILISCNALYFAVGLSILHFMRLEQYQGLFTVGMGAVNFVFAYRYYRMPSVDRNLFYALVGLVLTFITLAAPIQMEGERITLFWSAEAVLLLWLAQKSGISLLRLGSILVNGLMLVSLVMDQEQIYGKVLAGAPRELDLILNPAFITGAICIASLVLSNRLLRRENGPFFFHSISLKAYSELITSLSVLAAYAVPFLELYAQTDLLIHNADLKAVFRGSYHFIALSVLLEFAYKRAGREIRSAGFFIAVSLSLIYLLYYQVRIIGLQEAYLLDRTIGLGAYLLHFLLIAGVVLILREGWRLLKSIEEDQDQFRPFYRWFAAFILVFMASAELDQIVLWIGAGSSMSLEALRDQNAMIGYPILWGLASFWLMWQGLRKKIRNLRIISLTLFALTLLKLFLFDLQDIPEVGRVIAFISLGVLLLIVSFMYQKLKGIVLDDKDPEA